MVPIRSDYFVRDLAIEIGLPVPVVAQNRLGCLNHTLLTVHSAQETGLRCAGVVLNGPTAITDIAMTTNADILASILDVPLLPQLVENTANCPRNGGEFWPVAGNSACKPDGHNCK